MQRLVLRVQGLRFRVSDVLMRFESWCEGAVREGASERQRTHATRVRSKRDDSQALSEHQHASTRLGVQCMNALILCVWSDHACLSLLGKRPAGCDAMHTWQSLEQ